MDGMILAAGLGTRLLPITEDTPKALVEVGGMTLLERTIKRLTSAGCDRIVVNLHHHTDRVEKLLSAASATGRQATGALESPYSWPEADILVSREPQTPLETGGGLKHARELFRGDRTILLHNVDVISDLDLAVFVAAHESSGALATLAVNRRPATRYLVFDANGLCGRIDTRSGREEWARAPGEGAWEAGFTGIHAVSRELPAALEEAGAFSIIEPYLRLAGAGVPILPYDVTGCLWLDVGTPERLATARAHFGDPSP